MVVAATVNRLIVVFAKSQKTSMEHVTFQLFIIIPVKAASTEMPGTVDSEYRDLVDTIRFNGNSSNVFHASVGLSL